jgi:hypothetical protein
MSDNPYVNGFITLIIQCGRDWPDNKNVKQVRNPENDGISTRFTGLFPSVYNDGNEDVILNGREKYTQVAISMFEEGEGTVIEAEQFYEITAWFDPYRSEERDAMVKNRSTGVLEPKHFDAKKTFNLRPVSIEKVDRPAYWPASDRVTIPLDTGSLGKAKLEDIPIREKRGAAPAEEKAEASTTAL